MLSKVVIYALLANFIFIILVVKAGNNKKSMTLLDIEDTLKKDNGDKRE